MLLFLFKLIQKSVKVFLVVSLVTFPGWGEARYASCTVKNFISPKGPMVCALRKKCIGSQDRGVRGPDFYYCSGYSNTHPEQLSRQEGERDLRKQLLSQLKTILRSSLMLHLSEMYINMDTLLKKLHKKRQQEARYQCICCCINLVTPIKKLQKVHPSPCIFLILQRRNHGTGAPSSVS